MNFDRRVIGQPRIIRKPAAQPENTKGQCRYSVGMAIQLDRDTCMLVAGMEEQDGPDLCVGNDAFIFRKLSDISETGAIPVNRPEADFRLPHTGEPCFLIKAPAAGACVPLGEAHPVAGHGFLYCTSVAYKQDRTDPLPGYEGAELIEKIDFSWDGSKLEFGKPEFLDFGGRRPLGTPITGPVRHGDGFLALFSANGGIVPAHFEFTGGSWRITSLGETFGQEHRGASEASIRKYGNRYIAAFRPDTKTVPFYESYDGFKFRQTGEYYNNTVPRVLNQEPDGSLYLTTNASPGMLRNPLLYYPMKRDLSGFDEPFAIHDEKGIRTDSGDSIPFVDHAIASNVFLEGRERHLLVYRVCDLKERTLYGFQGKLKETLQHGRPPEQVRNTTGTYIVEIEFTSPA